MAQQILLGPAPSGLLCLAPALGFSVYEMRRQTGMSLNPLVNVA